MASEDKKISDKEKPLPPGKKYTTRQVMEMTEKRRKQMAEEARLLKAQSSVQAAEQSTREFIRELTKEESAEPEPVSSPHKILKAITPSRIEEQKVSSDFLKSIKNFTSELVAGTSRRNITQEREYLRLKSEAAAQAAAESYAADVAPATPNETESSAAFVRRSSEHPDEQSMSQTIERELDKTSYDYLTVDEANKSFNPELQKPKAQPVALEEFVAEVDPGILKAERSKKFAGIWAQVLSGLFGASAFVLFTMMLTPLFVEGWSSYFYEQTPFVLIVALATVWFNRRNLRLRTEWFLGSAVIVAGGLGVYMAAAYEGRTYFQLAGFLVTCLGLFLWRYDEESACRMIFPLSCFFFMFAPPPLLEWAATSHLNDAVFRLSHWILNSFHIVTQFDGMDFHVRGGAIDTAGDPTTFRTIFVAMLLAAVCVSFQNMKSFWSLFLFLSVVFWGILGNVVRVSVTGVMLNNFGLEYASTFFSDYSVVVVMLFTVAGLTLTAGLLPHKEE